MALAHRPHVAKPCEPARYRVAALLLLLVSALSACGTVPQNRRARFADPMMSVRGESLDAARRQKLYDTREGAAGGDGTTAGGGCDCQ